MKSIIISIFTLMLCAIANAQSITNYQQLVLVNKTWQYQTDIEPSLKNTIAIERNEQQLVQHHLEEVEKLLRSRDTKNLTSTQKENRHKILGILHGYRVAGNFPKNTNHQNRQPYFIDEFNTFCAVGYLMKQTGDEAMARDISKNQNYYYLADISHPRLMEWVSTTGLSLTELALIQPTYGGEHPTYISEIHYNNVGKDTLEYIEILETNYSPMYSNFDSIYFYNSKGIKYKSLAKKQLTAASVYKGIIDYYLFPIGDTIADKGRITLIKSGVTVPVFFIMDYNADSVVTQSYVGYFVTRTFKVVESDTTPIGKSLNFCGGYSYNVGNNTYTSIDTISIGTKNICVIAPVEFGSFTYEIINKSIQLNWQTFTETNNHHFEVERSIDGKNFSLIGTIPAGKNVGENNYQYIDERPDYINQYRIKQVDNDGKYSYSKILFAKMVSLNPLKVIANPVKENATINIGLETTEVKTMELYDLYGRKIKIYVPRSGNQLINVQGIADGKYLLVLITAKGEVYSQPLMILK